MKFFRNILIIILIIFTNYSIFAETNVNHPALFNDGEYLIYKEYANRELFREWRIVFFNEPESNGIIQYLDYLRVKEPITFPDFYTNYESKADISYNSLGLIHMIDNWYPEALKLKKSGNVYLKIDLNQDQSRAFYVKHHWNGRIADIAQNSLKIPKPKPVWNRITIMYSGPRVMDMGQPCEFYLIEPDLFWEPILCRTKVIGKEEIITPAGRFKTMKIGAEILEPWIAAIVLKPFTGGICLWYEDSPERRVVRINYNQDNYIELFRISNWFSASE